MAALDTYSQLVTETQDWLFGRADIVAKVPTFIRMFEAKANRTLFVRQMEGRASTPVNLLSAEPEFVSLPDDFQTMRRIRLKDAAGKPHLRFATGIQLDDFRERNRNAPGQPTHFSILGDELELYPTPAALVTLEMIYRKTVPALSATPPNTTNWLLTLAPDAYLYGTLMEAAPYLRDDERIAVWSAGVTGAFDQLNRLSEQAQYNAGPLVIRRRGY